MFLDSPPPSNRNVDDEPPAEPPQAVIPMPSEGTSGLTPGGVISVAPGGTPAGRVERIASGDVAPMPPAGAMVGEATCPEADIGHAVPIISDARRQAIAIVRRANCWAWLVSERSCTRTCVLRLELLSAER